MTSAKKAIMNSNFSNWFQPNSNLPHFCPAVAKTNKGKRELINPKCSQLIVAVNYIVVLEDEARHCFTTCSVSFSVVKTPTYP